MKFIPRLQFSLHMKKTFNKTVGKFSWWFIKNPPFVGKIPFFLIETVGKFSYKSYCFDFTVSVSWGVIFRANFQFSLQKKWLQRICRKFFLQPHHCNHFFFNCHFKAFVIVIFSLWFSYITTYSTSQKVFPRLCNFLKFTYESCTKVFCNQKQKIIQHDWNIHTHFYSGVCKSYKQIDMTNIKKIYKRSEKKL